VCFRPFGIDKIPVIHHGTGSHLPRIVQLKFPQEVETHVEGLKFKTCRLCGGRKYMPIDGCRFPPPEQVIAPLFRSTERFNDHAFRVVYVRMDLYGVIHAAGLKGAIFAEPDRGIDSLRC
jgi:hypothetical protein